MSNNSGGMSCAMGCWVLAAVASGLLAVFLLMFGEFGLIGTIFMAGLAFAVLGVVFSFLFCRPLPALGTVTPGEKTGLRAVPPGEDDGHDAKPAPAPAAQAEPAAKPAPAAAEKTAASGDGDAGIKPSKALAGQEELAARKGEWKFGDDSAPGKEAAADTAPAADAKPETAAVEGPGTKPETLSGPRDGTADDLKRIKGIGPKLETLCNTLGFYHFDQIAGWTAEEVAWVDQNLEGFKGRVTRDNWVEQARQLAAGEETDFSKKVDKGDVY